MRPLALVLAFAVSTAGCAMVGAKAPAPDRPRNEVPDCNTGKGGVAVDGLMAAVFGIATIAAGANDGGTATALLGLTTLAYGVSAGVGNGAANKCKAAQEDYAAYLEEQEQERGVARLGGLPTVPPVDESEDEVVAPTPVPPRPTPPVVTPPRPTPPRPTPRTAAATDDDDAATGDAADAGAADDDDDPWHDFWKELP